MSLKQNKYKVLVSTHKGRVRSENEDNFVFKKNIKRTGNEPQHLMLKEAKEPLLCAVFDGMGGENGGRQASEISATIAVKYYHFLLQNGGAIADSIQDYIATCNTQIKHFLSEHKLKRGGSTFAMIYFKDGIAQLFSMGDSRIYLYRNSALLRISRDHTLAQKKYEANIFTKEEAESSTESHMLTRFLGMDEDSDEFRAEEYSAFRPEKGDKLLICSDGLYDMCSDREIARILSVPNQPYTIQLVEKALQNGGEDNITCMVIENA